MPSLRVLHFNDVYHAGKHAGKEHRAARFLAAVEPYLQSEPKPLVVCCGDILAPSLMSTMTHGKHMMEVIELIGVNVGTLGNVSVIAAAAQLILVCALCAA